jgi:hypothetical protein
VDERRCKNCRFSREKIDPNYVYDNKGSHYGLSCSRFPPTVERDSDNDLVVATPLVDDDWWCGEWEEKA